MHIKVSLLSEFKSHINLSPTDNFFKVRMINVILYGFKKLAPGKHSKKNILIEDVFSDSISSEKHFSQMRFSKGAIGF